VDLTSNPVQSSPMRSLGFRGLGSEALPSYNWLVGVSARGLSVQVAVRCKRQGHRRIGTIGYRGRFTGVSARGLVST